MIRQSNAAKGSADTPYPGFAGSAVTHRYEVDILAATVAGDIYEVAPIPPGCRVTDIVLDSDDLDTGGSAAMVLDVGIMSGDWGSTAQDRTCGDEFFDGATTAQAGGVARPTLASAYRTCKSGRARSIGIKVVTKAATAQAGKIGLTVTVAA